MIKLIVYKNLHSDCLFQELVPTHIGLPYVYPML